MSNKPICPICEGVGVPARGPVDSNVLIVGEFPGQEELRTLKVFSGGAGAVLRQEFANCDLDMNDFRITNLWIHAPNENEECLKFSMNLLKDEAKGKKAILLVGSETVAQFTDYTVSDVNGLEVDSKFFNKADIVMAMFNPAIVFHKTVGEVRLAVRRFSDEVIKRELVEKEAWE